MSCYRGIPVDRRAFWIVLSTLAFMGCGNELAGGAPQDMGGDDTGAGTSTSNGEMLSALDAGPSDTGAPQPDGSLGYSAPEREEPCAEAVVSTFMVPEQPGYVGVLAADRLFLSLTYLRSPNAPDRIYEWHDDTTVRPATPATDQSQYIVAGSDRWLWYGDGAYLYRLDLQSGETRREPVSPPPADAVRRGSASQRASAAGNAVGWLETGTAHYYDGSEVRRLAGSAAASPFVFREHVAWFGEENSRFFIAVDGRRLEEDVPVTWPVVADADVFFLRDEKPIRLSLETGATTGMDGTAVGNDIRCGPLRSDGMFAVAGCSSRSTGSPGRSGRSGYDESQADRVMLFTSGSSGPVWELRTEGMVHSPIVNGPWLTWFEFRPPVEGARRGHVTVLNLRDQKPVKVGDVLWPCDAECDKIPSPALELGANRLSWNYAVGGVDAPHFGVANLVDTCPR